MLREIRDLGFEYAELSHGIRVSLVPGILDAVDAGEIKISTLHNFCPLPLGVNHAAPNIYQFTSSSRRERANALKYTYKTIEFAKRVGAKLIVLHMGSMDIKNFTDALLELIEEGHQDSDKFQKLVMKAVDKQEKYKTKPMELTGQALGEIAKVAAENGLLLGVENRESLEEIPLDGEMSLFLEDFPAETVRYWHDCGHGQIKENLGFIAHSMHVENLADRLGGFHLHDVAFPGKDHQPPGKGMIDFAALKPFVKPEHIKVFEMSPGLSSARVKEGIEHLQSIWGTE